MVKETEVPWYQSFDCRSGNHSDCMFNGTNSNTAIGFESLFHANGSNNTGLGDESLYALTSGIQNTGLGSSALVNLNTGSNNIGIGFGAGADYTGSESNNIVIGSLVLGTVGESYTLRIGSVITANMASLTGLGYSPIYGVIDARTGLAVVDGAAKTLYTTTAAGQVYTVFARIISTAGVSATYTIKWTEGGAVRTLALTITALGAEIHDTFDIQPDTATAITAQLTAIAASTVNVESHVAEVK